MPTPTGFEWIQRKNGDVVVTHHGKVASILRGMRASKFVAAVTSGDAQDVMARVTGNYKRGNERRSREARPRE